MIWTFGLLILCLLAWVVDRIIKDPTQDFRDNLDDEEGFEMGMPDATAKTVVAVGDLGPLLARMEEVFPGLSFDESSKVLERAKLMRIGRTATLPIQIATVADEPEELQVRLGKPRPGEILILFLGREATIDRLRPLLEQAE